MSITYAEPSTAYKKYDKDIANLATDKINIMML